MRLKEVSCSNEIVSLVESVFLMKPWKDKAEPVLLQQTRHQALDS